MGRCSRQLTGAFVSLGFFGEKRSNSVVVIVLYLLLYAIQCSVFTHQDSSHKNALELQRGSEVDCLKLKL